MPKFIFARGLQKGGEVAFRPEFSEVGELRALVPSLSVNYGSNSISKLESETSPNFKRY